MTSKPSLFATEKRFLSRIPYPIVVGAIVPMRLMSLLPPSVALNPMLRKIMRFMIARGKR